MSAATWLRRFVIAFLFATGLLLGARLLKGEPLAASAWSAVLWGTVSAGLYTLIGYARYRCNHACMLPRSRQP